MRAKIVVGNWKMNLNRAQATELASGLAAKVAAYPQVQVGVCPPSVYLESVKTALGSSAIGLGAQNSHFEAKGAFTGELAPAMLLDVGCKYVILGHSERRSLFGETSAFINKKVVAALAAGLTPILCVGETLEERNSGKTSSVVRTQFTESLANISGEQLLKVVIAYEPVWAIGTGVVATPEQAEEVHADLRALMTTTYGAEVAEKIQIQYGGSVTADNAQTLLGQKNIDGALVGGASLKVDSFAGILDAAQKLSV